LVRRCKLFAAMLSDHRKDVSEFKKVADKSKRVVLKMDRIEHWVGVGAQPSDKVATLIKKVKTGSFGSAKAPAPMQAPKERPKLAPAEEAPAAEGEAAAEAPAEG